MIFQIAGRIDTPDFSASGWLQQKQTTLIAEVTIWQPIDPTLSLELSPSPSTHRTMSKNKTPTRPLDRLLWVLTISVGILVVVTISFLLVVQLNYWNNKIPVQRELMAQAEINLIDLPADALIWRLPADSLGSPLDDYIRVQWDYRSFEPDYLAFKLRNIPLPLNIDGPRLLIQAAKRPLHESSLAEEFLLRPHDIADCAAALLRQANALRQHARNPAVSPADAAADIEHAEQLIRAYYTTGLYLATRRFRVDCISVGISMMISSAEVLQRFSMAQQRSEETARLALLILELRPLAERLNKLMNYISDDGHLEVWVTMLEQSRSPAVRLHAAGLLARTASMWWRYAESSRAIQVLRTSVASNQNHSIRSAVFDLIEAIERGSPIPADYSELAFDESTTIIYVLDVIF